MLLPIDYQHKSNLIPYWLPKKIEAEEQYRFLLPIEVKARLFKVAQIALKYFYQLDFVTVRRRSSFSPGLWGRIFIADYVAFRPGHYMD